MLDRIVSYLRGHRVPFRLSSQPSPEPSPAVAFSVPAGGIVVETHVLLIAGEPALACVAHAAQLSLPALSHELGAEVFEGTSADLPEPYTGVVGPVPPLGGAMGILTVVDARVSAASAVVFAAFSPHDSIEIPYDDLARLERPRQASFAVGGELPANAGAPERRAA
jgi:prolyl-tRNA editing enzyme YbaK/EbsC (Cys-tRNA(Pro) deacylase)